MQPQDLQKWSQRQGPWRLSFRQVHVTGQKEVPESLGQAGHPELRLGLLPALHSLLITHSVCGFLTRSRQFRLKGGFGGGLLPLTDRLTPATVGCGDRKQLSHPSREKPLWQDPGERLGQTAPGRRAVGTAQPPGVPGAAGWRELRRCPAPGLQLPCAVHRGPRRTVCSTPRSPCSAARGAAGLLGASPQRLSHSCSRRQRAEQNESVSGKTFSERGQQETYFPQASPRVIKHLRTPGGERRGRAAAQTASSAPWWCDRGNSRAPGDVFLHQGQDLCEGTALEMRHCGFSVHPPVGGSRATRLLCLPWPVEGGRRPLPRILDLPCALLSDWYSSWRCSSGRQLRVLTRTHCNLSLRMTSELPVHSKHIH